jgi:hypothetical protein
LAERHQYSADRLRRTTLGDFSRLGGTADRLAWM